MVASPIFGGWIDCSHLMIRPCLDSATHNPSASMLVFIQCLEYSFSSLAIFVPDMGIAGVAWDHLSRLVGLVGHN